MRLGSAYMEIHEYALAQTALLKAAELEPNNKMVRDLLAQLQAMREEAKKKDRSLYYGIFSKGKS